MTIPETIKTARLKARLTQQALGEALGYEGTSADSTVRRWESGSRPVPLEKIRKLAEVLQIPLDTLIP